MPTRKPQGPSKHTRIAVVLVSVIAAFALIGFLFTLPQGPQQRGAERPEAETRQAPTEVPAPAPATASGADGKSAPARAAAVRSAELRGIAALPDPEWVAQVSKQTGIPIRPLTAYAGAALQLETETPGCGIDWATLAGIGRVESNHGTLHGGGIDRSGAQTPAIFGIPLDGTTTERIPDSDGGALDGDPSIDRAVGPMQFIPTTWALYGSDGNDDGIADPQQIDDAALSAAHYLCAAGGNLSDANSWINAVTAYNDTVDYNHRVVAAADEYAAKS